MSRLQGWAQAGRSILFTKPASRLAQYGGRFSCLITGGVLLMAGFAVIVGVMGQNQMPVPERKPDLDGFVLVQAAPSAAAPRAPLSVSYRSPLKNADMDLYATIFQLQAIGDMAKAEALIPRLNDDSLMGHVLAQRLLHPSHKASFEELKNWLALYADLPQAPAIERLARARRPAGDEGKIVPAAYQKRQVEEHDALMGSGKTYEADIARTVGQAKEAQTLMRAIRDAIRNGSPARAQRLFNEGKASAFLDDVEKDRVKALIASGFFYAGDLKQAASLSRDALMRSGAKAPMAGWIYGLTAWRMGEYKTSAMAFAHTASSPYASSWMISAASFWAARGYLESGDRRRAYHYHTIAAQYPRTFYGLLAVQSLGKNPDLNWSSPSLSSAAERAILQTPAGARAERLIAAGEISLAEAEILALYESGNTARKQDLLAFAYDRGLPNLTLKLAHALSNKTGQRFDSALYPAMPWTPDSGFRIDRALIHAIIRQESRFNAMAENKSSGATGLMQLMPRTADYIAQKDVFDGRDGRYLLKIPEVSLTLGQKYIEHLLNHPVVGQDLLSLAIAYNAGPGTLSKWKSERADITDPLLFIESIPYAETRAFVERVLSNYWVYRFRFDQRDDSLQALASGDWARYAAQDKDSVRFAQR